MLWGGGVALGSDGSLVGCPSVGSTGTFNHGVALKSSGRGFLLYLLCMGERSLTLGLEALGGSRARLLRLGASSSGDDRGGRRGGWGSCHGDRDGAARVGRAVVAARGGCTLGQRKEQGENPNS